MGEWIVQREARPGADMNLLVLGVHRVFGERLKMLPAAQRAQSPDVGAVVDGKIAAVALAEHRALGMRRAQLAAPGDGFALGAAYPLRHVQSSPLAFHISHTHR